MLELFCFKYFQHSCPVSLFHIPLREKRASQVVQTVKNLPAVQETWVQSLGQEDNLDKTMVTHSSTLTWRIPGTEQATVHGVTKSQTWQRGKENKQSWWTWHLSSLDWHSCNWAFLEKAHNHQRIISLLNSMADFPSLMQFQPWLFLYPTTNFVGFVQATSS